MSSKKRKHQVTDYVKHFSDFMEKADSSYIESLANLKRIRKSRKAHQARQLKRLLKTSDEKSPKVQRQVERVSREREMQNYLEITLDKATAVKELVKDAYVLSGKVRADNIETVAGYKVQLVDARNNTVGKAVKTDKQGNYKIVVNVSEKESHGKLSVKVFDKGNIEVHKDSQPVVITKDHMETRDLLLPKVDKYARSRKRVLTEARGEYIGTNDLKKTASSTNVARSVSVKKSSSKKLSGKKKTSKKMTARKKKTTVKKARSKKTPKK